MLECWLCAADLMKVVVAVANESAELREKLFQVNFHTGLSGDSMVTLLYHKVSDRLAVVHSIT